MNANEQGWQLEQVGDLEGAEQAYRRAVQLGEDEAETMLGRVLNMRGDSGGAERAWRSADTKGSSTAAYNLGHLQFLRGDLDEAERTWQRAAEGGQPYAAMGLATIAESRGNAEASQRWSHRAGELEYAARSTPPPWWMTKPAIGMTKEELDEMEIGLNAWREAWSRRRDEFLATDQSNLLRQLALAAEARHIAHNQFALADGLSGLAADTGGRAAILRGRSADIDDTIAADDMARAANARDGLARLASTEVQRKPNSPEEQAAEAAHNSIVQPHLAAELPSHAVLELPCRALTADGAVEGLRLRFEEQGVRCSHPTSGMQLFITPWRSVQSVTAEGPEVTERRATVSRYLAVGVLSFLAKKNVTRSYAIIKMNGVEHFFEVTGNTVFELRAKLSGVTSWLAGYG